MPNPNIAGIEAMSGHRHGTYAAAGTDFLDGRIEEAWRLRYGSFRGEYYRVLDLLTRTRGIIRWLWATGMVEHPRNTRKKLVANTSPSGPGNVAFDLALISALRAGILVAIAAGSNTNPIATLFPGGYEVQPWLPHRPETGIVGHPSLALWRV